MPNYDYECLECGKRFEVFQSMKDDKLTDCPEENCEGKIRRLLGTGGGIIFKGSGFYQTDYRSSSYQSGEKAEKATSSSGSSDSAKSGTSKGDSGKKDSSSKEKKGESKSKPTAS